MCSTELISTGSEDPSSTTNNTNNSIRASVPLPALSGGAISPTMSTTTTIPVPGSNLKMADTTNKNPNPNRRSNKPIMEKRRRARINNCLNELKAILLEAMRKDPARHSKLEKADILELTVSHLKSLHRSSSVNNVEAISKFRAGFSECINEVGRFLTTTTNGKCDEIQARLLNHLADCLGSNCNSATTMLNSTNVNIPNSAGSGSLNSLFNFKMDDCLVEPNNNVIIHPPRHHHHNLLHQQQQQQQSMSISPNNANNNNTPIISLVPSRLPSGEFAFVLPGFNSSTIQVINSNNNNTTLNSPTNNAVHTHQHQIPSISTTITNRRSSMLSPEVPLELTVSPPTTVSPAVAQATSISPAYPSSAFHKRYIRFPSGESSNQAMQTQLPPNAHQRFNFQATSQDLINEGQPLSLVTNSKREDESCWRPW